MCGCNKKISGPMKTKDLGKSAINYALLLGGAVAAQEAGKMVPATTLDPMYTDAGKVVLGALVLPMLTKNPTVKTIGEGFAIQGGLNLVNQYLLNGAPAVSGVDNRDYALMGVDNRDYALMGYAQQTPGSQPIARGSVATYSM